MDSFKFYDDFSEESHRLSFVNSSSDNQHFISEQKEKSVKIFRTFTVLLLFSKCLSVCLTFCLHVIPTHTIQLAATKLCFVKILFSLISFILYL